jgi:uncharacterized protein
VGEKMINFKKVEIDDKQWMEPLIASVDVRACHINFTNIFSWSDIYKYGVAKVNDFLVVKGESDLYGPYYFYPTGSGDIRGAIELMNQDANDCGHGFTLVGLSPENIEVLKNVFPDHFEYETMRESYDYLYLLEKLVSLSGNKLHSKRNHINRFKENNNWSFEPITLDNIGECWEMNTEWCKINDYNEDDQFSNDSCAVRHCFENFLALGLDGGLLRSEGRVIAYTMGEKLNSDTYVIHIEKAFGEIQGAYQMINREFADYVQHKHPQMVYVNREEDMGYEGLRKAKLSYNPVKMEEKYVAKYFLG